MRWLDLDAQGHVNASVVVAMSQQAWAQFLAEGGQSQLFEVSRIIKAQVQYLAPIHYSVEPLTVSIELLGVTSYRVRAEFTFSYKGKGYAVMRASIGRLLGADSDADADTLPEDARAWFQNFLNAGQIGQVAAKALTSPPPLASVKAAKNNQNAGVAEKVEPLAAMVSEEKPELEPYAEAKPEADSPFPDFPKWRVGPSHHEFSYALRPADTRADGYIGPAAAFNIIAEARIRMNPVSTTSTRMDEAAALGIIWALVRQDVDFLAPFKYTLEPLRVHTSYAAVGNTSMTLVAEVLDSDDTALIRSVTVLVATDSDGKPTPVPETTAHGFDLWPATLATL
jgi:acyl-CoA thioesterase FadM